MKGLPYITSVAAMALGLALAPAALAAHGGGGFEGGHIGGAHLGGFDGGHELPIAGGHEFAGRVHGNGPHGGRPVYGPGGVFDGYDFGYGFGYAYPGYVIPPWCSQYPDDYNPGAGCYLPYIG